jgi:hypothetical protein
LGFVPLCIVYFYLTGRGDESIYEANEIAWNSTTDFRRSFFEVDANKLTLGIELGADWNIQADDNYTFKYYILRGSARF